MKRYTLLWISMFVALITDAQTIISLDPTIENPEATAPRCSVEKIEHGVIVTYYFDNVTTIQDPLFSDCKVWSYAGFGQNDVAGEPAVPFHCDNFAMPNNVDISVTVVDSSFVDIPGRIAPARLPIVESSNDTYTTDNVIDINPFKGFFPQSILKTNEGNDYRGVPILGVTISPLQYNYEEQFIRAYSMIKYRITYTSPSKRSITESNLIDVNDHYLELTTLANLRESNSNTSRELDIDSPLILIPRNYLILTNNILKSEADRFAEWKRILGFNVHVIASDSWSINSVRDTIRHYYNNPISSSLKYLLIFGDETVVPPTTILGSITDYPYLCMGGILDTLPDILHGRIPVNTASEAEIVVNKMINYERNPVIDTSFYNTALHSAYFQDADEIGGTNVDGISNRRFVQTSEDVLKHLQHQGKTANRVYYTESHVNPIKWDPHFGGGDSIPEYLIKPAFTWDGGADDIMEHINQGALYALQRGHGAAGGWDPPFFRRYHASALTNGNKLPIVFSICCSTGQYDYVNHDSFVEECLNNPNGGAVAVIAATSGSISGFSDILTIGMFDAIWPNPSLRPNFGAFANMSSMSQRTKPTYELGSILNIGKSRLYELKPNNTNSNKTAWFYHLFGDPSMQIITENPTAIAEPIISKVDSTYYVILSDSAATISFYNPNTKNIQAFLGTNTSCQGPSNVSISIYRHNQIPYIVSSIDNIYIQNETINDNRSYTADTIRVGYNVTDKKANGEVVFNANLLEMNAKRVFLRNQIRVPKGKKLIIR